MADIKDVVEQLEGLGYLKWHPCTVFLRNFDIYQHEYSAPADFVEYAVGVCILCHDSYLTPEKLFLRSVDIVITERCSMRCRDCSNLMRYYDNPKDGDTKKLIRDIKKLCRVVDEINEFRVIGGEPLMNKDFHLIMDKILDEVKVKKVVVYTNGTVLLRKNQVKYLKNKKVLFLITDYGGLSRNLVSLRRQLSDNGISFYIQKAKGWTDCAKIVKHNRNSGQQNEIFRNCCVKNATTLLNGKLYRCPFSANANNLRAVPDYKAEYININQKVDIKKLKKRIRSFLFKKKHLRTCDYCNGRSFGDPEIKPAIQVMESLKYKRFNY